jgi:CubicO group peptidase (beta-lactamase class C family)
MISKLFSAVLSAAVLSTCVSAQPLPEASPESVGMSSERLTRINSAISREISDGNMPGAVIAVARRGKLVYFESFGYRDKDANVPMPKDAIFPIASMSKAVTSVAALVLFERGELLLEQPIQSYLPEIPEKVVSTGGDPQHTVLAHRQPTIQDLMRHTSGFSYSNTGDTPLHELYPTSEMHREEFTREAFEEAFETLPLHHQPGETWDYSLGLELLGLIIERISGQSLGEFFREEIFDPLGMSDTSFSVPRRLANRVAQMSPDNPAIESFPYLKAYTHAREGRFECGGACLASTAEDFIAFGQMLLNKGALSGRRILGSATVDLMTSDHTTSQMDLSRLHGLQTDHLEGYGMGLGVAVRTQTGVAGTPGSIGEFHWHGGGGTAFWVDPAQELVIVHFAFTPGPIRARYRQLIPALVYQAIED